MRSAAPIFGRRFRGRRWCLRRRMATGEGGPCLLPGAPAVRLHAPQAALALGAFAHSFELDNLRKPAPACIRAPRGAAGLGHGAGGGRGRTRADHRDRCRHRGDVRIGGATLHSPEHVGFHAPGMTGPFGAAAVCASLLRLQRRADRQRLRHRGLARRAGSWRSPKPARAG